MAKRVFTTYQVANMLGATPGAVVQWIKQDLLAHEKPPAGPVRISESSLVKFLRERDIDAEAILGKATGEEEPLFDRKAALAAPDAVAAQVAEAILIDATGRGAEAVHLVPCRRGLNLQVRVRGVLQEKPNFLPRLPKGLGPRLIAHLLARAGLDAGQPQTAAPRLAEFTYTVGAREVQLRLSAFPTMHGTRIVIHLPVSTRDLVELGLGQAGRTRLEQLLHGGAGMVLVAGRSKMARNEMLHALLLQVAAGDETRSIATVEEAIRIEVGGVAQTQVDPAAGFTYAAAMEALAGQDTDVILVDKLHDSAAAGIAVAAAHGDVLVLAGSSAPSAPEAIAELLAMGLEPWRLAAALYAVVEQASIRTLCEHCKKTIKPSPELLRRLGLRNTKRVPAYAAAVGCRYCGRTGYAGKISLCNVFFVEGRLADLIRAGTSDLKGLQRASAQRGRKNLRQLALERARQGVTSLKELARVLGA